MTLETLIPIILALISVAGSIYTFRKGLPKQAAEIERLRAEVEALRGDAVKKVSEARASEGQAASNLAQAADTLGDVYKEQLAEMRDELHRNRIEIVGLNKRLDETFENLMREQAYRKMLDQKAQDLANDLRDLTQRFRDLQCDHEKLQKSHAQLLEEYEALVDERDALQRRVMELGLRLAEAQKEQSQ